MRVAYANAFYKASVVTGRNVHVKQFIDNATALGHEIWTWARDEYPKAAHLPAGRAGRYLKLRGMDVVYVRVEDDAPFEIRLGTTPYRQICGSPLMVWEFNAAPTYGSVVGRSAKEISHAIREFRRCASRCDLAICVSDALSDYVRRELGVKHVVTVPNGSDPAVFRPGMTPVRRLSERAGNLNVVWIGSAELPYNNFDLLRQAAEILSQRDVAARVQFHILGSGLKGMRDMPPNIQYYGAEEYERMPGWLAAMDVGLCLYRPGPSDYCSPLKLFDYMSSGLAVVSNKQPQVCEVLSGLGDPGLFVDHDDAQGLAAVLEDLARDRDRVRRLGSDGRRLVVEHYNWERAVRETFEHITELLSARQRRPRANSGATPRATSKQRAAAAEPTRRAVESYSGRQQP